MSVVVRFSPDLGRWLTDQLDRGEPAAGLVATMIRERMDPVVARSIVDAFVSARATGAPVPIDSVTLDEASPEYVYEEPILSRKSSIRTSDRVVHTLARSERPMVAVLGNVIDKDECRELIELARPRLTRSTVVDPASGRDVIADYRTSEGMFFQLRENPLIARLDQRISEVMNLPVEKGEGFQVLRYPEGGSTAPHFDFLLPSNDANRASIARSGQRVSSLVIYLNDVEEGGETVFPSIGFSVTPVCGHAVYFEYCNRRGQVDHQTLHAGTAVVRGEKWVATKWMRQRRFVSADQA